MKTALIAVALLGACVDEEPASTGDPETMTGVFELEVVRQMVGKGRIAGIDSDREGGLWIAYSYETGTYWTNDDVRIVHLDANGEQTVEHRLTDEFADVSGIAFAGDALWLNHNGGNNYMRALDPITGAVTKTFATGTGVVDLDANGDELLLSVSWDYVLGLDAKTGGEKWRSYKAVDTGSVQRGIAAMADGRIWVGTYSERFYVLDPKVGIVGGASHPLLDTQSWNLHSGMHLAWDGEHVITAFNGQIFWLRPR